MSLYLTNKNEIRMVLIISSENDVTTHDVIDWFYHLSVPFIRISDKTKITIPLAVISDENHDIEFIFNDSVHKNRTINLTQISGIWYRRGDMNQLENNYQVSFNGQLKKNREKAISDYLDMELSDLLKLVHESFRMQGKFINSYTDNNTNKLVNLLLARKCQLKIPYSFVTIYKQILDDRGEAKSLISKALRHNVCFFENKLISSYTEEVEKKEFGNLQNRFSTSLFQEKIDKKYELRIFFLVDKFYSSAIFSQTNERTKVDFRKYDFEKPNRVVPYILPDEVSVKLVELMKLLNFTSASIDMIVDNNDDFIFLEANPVGQFFQVSYPCNYNLEKRIVEYFKS
jgi:ATP-GRASP peptide maturase of grasp-with-spasm system